ncbi:unnamed protein product, partial [Ectocarpus sp. 12 AP-2014]
MPWHRHNFDQCHSQTSVIHLCFPSKVGWGRVWLCHASITFSYNVQQSTCSADALPCFQRFNTKNPTCPHRSRRGDGTCLPHVSPTTFSSTSSLFLTTFLLTTMALFLFTTRSAVSSHELHEKWGWKTSDPLYWPYKIM